eukprot:11976664-Ditylum_brightwellii.AAC.1
MNEDVDPYQGDKNRSMHGQLQEAKKELRKVRSDGFENRQARQWKEAENKVDIKDTETKTKRNTKL